MDRGKKRTRTGDEKTSNTGSDDGSTIPIGQQPPADSTMPIDFEKFIKQLPVKSRKRGFQTFPGKSNSTTPLSPKKRLVIPILMREQINWEGQIKNMRQILF